MLTLFRSHSVEVLADALAQRLQHDVSSGVVSDPVTPQTVLVRTRAMGRWLALRLSEAFQPGRGGICANIRFHNGDRFLRNLVANLAAMADLGHDPWHPLQLRWSVAGELRDLQHSTDTLWQPLLQLWRRQQGDLIDRYRLGMLSGLADAFDRYTLYRQEMVLQWLQGRFVDGQGEPLPPEQCWQAVLYQRLHQRLGGLSPAERLRHAQQHLDAAMKSSDYLASLPSGPLRVFCPGHLPMPHLELMAAMAHHGSHAVELFVLTPSARPWGSIQERQRLLQQVDALRDYMGLLQANGHRLLASLGSSMRQFQATLEHLQQRQPLQVVDRFPATPAPSGHRAGPSPSPSLLERLRTDMLHLLNRDRLASDPAWQPLPVASADDSIKVLRCCSDLGQVEALRRWLLLLFHRHRHLQPRDVLVMTPDVERFAPLMQAVFTRTDDGDVHLPLHVADRLLRQDDPLLNLALLLLECTDERLDPSQLQDLLLHPLIHSQLGLEPGDGPEVAQLMQAMGVHWGIDADHRRRLGLPHDDMHTWRWGLRRLALALALDDPVAATLSAAQQGRYAVIDDASAPCPQQGCWHGLAAVPLRDDQVPLAHRLFAVLSQLVNAIDALTPPRPRQQWAAHLRSILLQLLGPQPPAGNGLLGLQVALEGLAGAAPPGEDSSSAPAIDAAAARCLLEESAANAQPYRGRHSAAVTLAALNPMRSIPHPVICLLGMDEGRIPRRDVQPAYNLMAAQPHPGDPDRAQDDRGLLLEALLASGGWLVATFTGSDPRTGEDRNPASPVSELLTCLDRGFDFRTGDDDLSPVSIRDHLLQDEPALPVDPLLYGGHNARRSFDASGVAAARALAAGAHNAPRPLPAHQARQVAPEPAVIAEPPVPPAPGDGLALDDLLAFWKDPHQQLLKAHHLAAPRPPGLPPGVEADELDGLEQWQLHQLLLLLLQTPGDHGTMVFAPHLSEPWTEGLQQRGYLPPAVGGRLLLQRAEAKVAKLLDRAVAACRDGGAVSREPVACTVQLPATGPADGGTTGLPQRLDGRLEGLWLPQQHQRLQLTASKLNRPDRLLQRWIEHLTLNAAQGGGWQSVWIGFDQECIGLAFSPLEASAAVRLLDDLVLLRCQGLRQPLPFEPGLSWQRWEGSRADNSNPTASWRLLHPAWCHAPQAWSNQPAMLAMGQRVFGPLRAHLGGAGEEPQP